LANHEWVRVGAAHVEEQETLSLGFYVLRVILGLGLNLVLLTSCTTTFNIFTLMCIGIDHILLHAPPDVYKSRTP